MSIQLVLQILRTRIWWVVLGLGITSVASLWFTTTLPPEYSATTSLVLDLPDNGPLGNVGFSRQLGNDYMMTQVDIIKSPKVARKVLADIPLEALTSLSDALLDDRVPRPLGQSDQQRLATRTAALLEVRPSRDSRVIYVTFRFRDPETTAIVANEFAKAYMDTALDMQTETPKRHALWFDAQLSQLRARLEEKQNQLTEYQQKTGILALDERLDAETRRFEQLSARLVEAQARTFEMRSRQLGSQHPEYNRALEQEQAINRSLASQREKLFAAKRERDEIGLLVQDVESSKQTYNTALQRFYQTSLESRFNQTNISILSEATVPYWSSRPGLLLQISIAGLLGIFVGLGVALFMELLDRRVHTQNDVVKGLGLNVLAKV